MQYVKNRETLVCTGETALRRLTLEIAEAALTAADPGVAVRRHVRLEAETLSIFDLRLDLSGGRKVFVIGAGKATFPIAKALDDILGARIDEGLVACKRGQDGALRHIDMILSSHPAPDESSQAVAQRTIEMLRQARPGDVVLACFTGGSSSLFALPAAGISLQDLAESTRVLLTCGANIQEINDVRKHWSAVKGGRLVRPLPPGVHLVNLTVSDVIGDGLAYITDPSVPDDSSFADAQKVLDRYRLWNRLPASVVEHLRQARPDQESVREAALGHLDRHDFILVRANEACLGAVQAAKDRGLTPLLLSTFFEGESSLLGRNFVAIAREVLHSGNPVAAPCVLIAGGETVVTASADQAMGMGGPNQEFAVGAALDLAGLDGVVVMGLDSDGTDGPTEYAGAIVDGRTLELARRAGVDLRRALQAHDVTPVLEAIGHHIVTGNTGTNVNDLKLVVISQGAAS